MTRPTTSRIPTVTLIGAAVLSGCTDAGPPEQMDSGHTARTVAVARDAGLGTGSALFDVALGAAVGQWQQTRAVYVDAQGVRDLHPPDATYSLARAVNDVGEAGGQIDNDAAVFLAGGGHVDVDTPASGVSTVIDINNAGQAIALRQDGQDQTGLFWSEATGTVEIGTLGGFGSVARDINDQGQVVGWSDNAAGFNRALLWDEGVLTDLGTLGGDISQAYAINDNGDVVGSAELPPPDGLSFGALHATKWEGGVAIDLDPENPGDSIAYGINNSGHVIGERVVGNELRGFYWPGNGEIIDLGPVGTFSLAINDSDMIIGSLAGSGFLWLDEAEGPITLPPLTGADHSSATAIDAAGLVVGASQGTSGSTAVTWETVLPQPSPGELVSAIEECLQDVADSHDGDWTPLRPLEASLMAAQRQLDRGNEDGAQAQLQAFIHQLQAFIDSGRVTEEEAACALELAEEAVDTLDHCFVLILSGDAPVEPPQFDVTNNADAVAITELLFHIGDESYYFDEVACVPPLPDGSNEPLCDPNPTGATELAPLGTVAVPDPSANTMQFTFTDFGPGVTFSWVADVDDDILGNFGVDHVGVFFNNDDADNATLTVWYSDGASGTAELPDVEEPVLTTTFVVEACAPAP